MIIVGEKINTSLKGVKEAVKSRDVAFIQQRAVEQDKNGADYIDVNCGTLVNEEVEALPWLVETVQQVVDKPCCIDSPNPAAIEAALKVHKGKAMINSITAEKSRYDKIVPLVKAYKSNVVALTMNDESGIPEDTETRVAIGKNLIDRLSKDGVPIEDIYIDPLIQPISTSSNMGIVALDSIKGIKEAYPEIHFMCGLSNISFGLPKRGLLNYTFLVLCMMAGLDGAILDPGNKQMMAMIVAAEALLNKDQFTMNYLKAFRAGLLEV
ncbi:methyltetrahydrofolate cobalamin methyltransferase [Clostridium formicaceticum]|uniref:5-methyltetrahydrofolate:corrinoid/iron-sulfur protein co-methyltransferase n=1 Tax=Clostridium formicaceticum TaxID=1497 RepID=A0AAC9RQN1_9CLOT|nr:methyltetrahydrofolate cobalamin methyltransferase [Clostridium formicaceticum]AOY74950.1 methyltetrahydrofolate--corrinoid methyltransferase [Clostridium formicaceticum]ARE89358.1 5-methyltetrahydrofolate:corrinoid/iron-sulfur protein co-methyltransferase [Clostridium formicaceticum]